MESKSEFVKAYHEFRESVELSGEGILPDLDHVIWCLLMGIPYVPADDDASPNAAVQAINQRVVILKAVFVEVNKNQSDEFLDQGLNCYDQAGKNAKKLLKEGEAPVPPKKHRPHSYNPHST